MLCYIKPILQVDNVLFNIKFHHLSACQIVLILPGEITILIIFSGSQMVFIENCHDVSPEMVICA